MTKIPSIETTEDFIYRLEIKWGTPLHDPDMPHLLAFEQFIGPAGTFHSMDVTTLRDGQHVKDIEFRSFEHVSQRDMTYTKFTFHDNANCVIVTLKVSVGLNIQVAVASIAAATLLFGLAVFLIHRRLWARIVFLVLFLLELAGAGGRGRGLRLATMKGPTRKKRPSAGKTRHDDGA